MSMIDSLIDELRKSADEWNGSNLFEIARMCRDAADTITELRGALQVASVDYRHLSEENDKLRELMRKVEHYERMGCHECPYVGICDAGTLYDEECVMSREIEREKGELGVDG